MKNLILCVGILCIAVTVSAVTMTLLEEEFYQPIIPPGWTTSGPSPGAWSREYTDYAGGSAGEIKLGNFPPGDGTFRFTTPPIDTRNVHDMMFSFKHFFSVQPPFINLYTLEVQLSRNLIDWQTLWSVNTSLSIPAQTVEIPIDYTLGQSITTYLSFTFTGNNGTINGWYLDDILLTYRGTIYSGIWNAGNHYPAGDIVILDGTTLQINAGASVFMDVEAFVDMRGRLLVNGSDSQRVLFTSETGEKDWWGINILEVNPANDSTLIQYAKIEKCEYEALNINSYDQVRVSHCVISNNSTADNEYHPGTIMVLYSNPIIEFCDVTGCGADYGILGYQCAPVVRFCRFFQNPISVSVIYLNNCDV